MAEKTPYEIRSNLLSLARDILSENMHMQQEAAEAGKGEPPTPYTTEAVIKEAEKLYAFVSTK
jgi:reverse gyrase